MGGGKGGSPQKEGEWERTAVALEMYVLHLHSTGTAEMDVLFSSTTNYAKRHAQQKDLRPEYRGTFQFENCSAKTLIEFEKSVA